jgi:hypothetical protein
MGRLRGESGSRTLLFRGRLYVKPRRNYALDEAAVRGAWYASAGDAAAADEASIRARANCSSKVAARVYVLRRFASPTLVTLWLDGTLTLRQAERIALAEAYDGDAQLREACEASPSVKRRYADADAQRD